MRPMIRRVLVFAIVAFWLGAISAIWFLIQHLMDVAVAGYISSGFGVTTAVLISRPVYLLWPWKDPT